MPLPNKAALYLLLTCLIFGCESDKTNSDQSSKQKASIPVLKEKIQLSTRDKLKNIRQAIRDDDKVSIKLFLENGLTVEAKDQEQLDSTYKRTLEYVFREDDIELFSIILPKGLEYIKDKLDIDRSLFTRALQKEKSNIFGLIITKHIEQSLTLPEEDIREYLHYYLDKKANNKVVDTLYFGQLISSLSDLNKPSIDGERLLLLAVKNNYTKITELLLSSGADIDQKGLYEWTALKIAAAKGNIELFQLLLDKGAKFLEENSNQPNSQKDKELSYQYAREVLHEAVEGGHLALLKLYPDKKYYNQYKLITATRLKDKAMIKFFLDIGFDINHELVSEDYNGWTALTEAVMAHAQLDEKDTNEYPIIDFLISNGAKVNLDGKRANVIVYAISTNSIKLVRHLINKGARLDKSSAEAGLTVYGGTYSFAPTTGLLAFLMKKGIDINRKDKMKETLLDAAIEAGNKELVNLLLKNGFKLSDDNSYLEDTIEGYHETRVEIAKLLAQHKLDPNALDRDGTPLVFRLLKPISWNVESKTGVSGNYEVLTNFKKPINFEIVNKKGENLLTALANGSKDIDIARFFFKNKFNVDTENNYGQTVLHTTAGGRDVIDASFLKFILNSNADINKKDEQGDTPLHAAVQNHNKDAISILLNYGADPKIKNFAGKLPREMVKDDSSTHDFIVFYEELLSGTILDDYAERHRQIIADRRCFITSQNWDMKTGFTCISDKLKISATLRKDYHEDGDHLINFSISEPRDTIQNLKEDSIVSSFLQSYNETETKKLRQSFYKLISDVEKIKPTEAYSAPRTTLEVKTSSDIYYGKKVDILEIQLIIAGNK